MNTIFFISQLWIKPSHQNKGIGTDIAQSVMRDAKTLDKYVRLYVLKTNRARRLYDRLGFIQYGEDEGDYYMKHEMQNVAE